MKVLQINAVYGYGSTGMIVKSISNTIEKNGDESYVAYQYCSEKPTKGYRIGNALDWKLHGLHTRIFGKQAYFSRLSTRKLLKWIEEIEPDIIHLHNLHANYINLNMICDYCREKKIPVVITLHDCWFFTGKCWHFAYDNCNRWKESCGNCPKLHKEVPSWFFDKTREVLLDKTKHLNELGSLNIVGCSDWIVNLAKQSHLDTDNYRTIYNGIDLDVFQPTKSTFREDNNISEDKIMLLGVASLWTEKKGIDTFISLSGKLPKDKFTIVLVGKLEKSEKLPDNIIHIEATENKSELAKIYTAADYFINPTLEEALGLVNIEALGCGTPVITFNTGGSPECIDEKCGKVICDNTDESLVSYLLTCPETEIFESDYCVNHAKQFSDKTQYEKYYSLYETIIQKKSETQKEKI